MMTSSMFSISLPPTTYRERLLLLRVVSLPCAPTCNRGMAQHVVFDRVGLTRNVPCKQRCGSGLNQHLICTEDVTVRHITKAKDMFSCRFWDMITYSSSSNSRTSANGSMFLIISWRRQYPATAAATAAMLSSMHVSIPRKVYV